MSFLGKIAGTILAASCLAANAVAQEAPSVSVVSEFEKACVAGELTLAARKVALEEAGWAQAPANNLHVVSFLIVPTIELNFDYRNPVTTEHFTKVFEGQNIHAVLASFDPKNRYPNLCAVVVSGVKNVGSPIRYTDAFRDVAKSRGLKGKSVDLPHYFEYSGKLSDGRPARSDIFSRSQAFRGANDMHMTFAF